MKDAIGAITVTEGEEKNKAQAEGKAEGQGETDLLEV